MKHRGGYDAVKAVSAVDYEGTRYVGCEHFSLKVHQSRSAEAALRSKDMSKEELLQAGVFVPDDSGLDARQAQAIHQTFDFYGPLVDWQKKKYVIDRRGMEKLPRILAYKLEVKRPDGYREMLYVDSHTGDIVREMIVDAKGSTVLQIWRHDFRDVGGSRYAFAVDYMDASGALLTSDRLQRIDPVRAGS